MPQVPDDLKYNRRPRTRFTHSQLSVMMDAFQNNNLPNPAVVKELAATLELDEVSIKVWFKNQRAKQKKKQLKMQLDSSPGTSTRHVFEKEEAPLPKTAANPAPSSTASDGQNPHPQEPSDTQITERDGASAFPSSSHPQCYDIQEESLENWDKPCTHDLLDTCELLELYDMPGEDDLRALNLYLVPECFQ
ncbi:PREDICTED: leucine-twenty homeobox-like [Chinchilla lanigera]|uniref:leucine-twenty homeobox-like n=1 Tax=Chinchilla lanigera TaxID=34839 RepID=UPI00069888F8|nr:PREDICTED: leucine-twenty homeobox-like [Chinchilla lanigera]